TRLQADSNRNAAGLEISAGTRQAARPVRQAQSSRRPTVWREWSFFSWGSVSVGPLHGYRHSARSRRQTAPSSLTPVFRMFMESGTDSWKQEESDILSDDESQWQAPQLELRA